MQLKNNIDTTSTKMDMWYYILELEDEIHKLRRKSRVHRQQITQMNRILENRQLRMARNYAEDRALSMAGYRLHSVG